MDKEQNKNLHEDSNWLDEILGSSEIAKELGPDELAVQAAGLTHPDDIELEKILAEDWDSVSDPQPDDMPPPLSIEDEPAGENLFDEVSEMAELDILTDEGAGDELGDGVIPEETESPDITSEEVSLDITETDDTAVLQSDEATEDESAIETAAEDAILAASAVETLEGDGAVEEAPAEEAPEEEAVEEDATEDLTEEEITDEGATEELTAEEVMDEGATEELSGENDAEEVTDEISDELTAEAILAEILAENNAEEEQASNEATVMFTPVSSENAVKENEAEEEKKPVEEKPKERKVRPKMKKGYGLLGIPHIAATMIWLMIIVVIGLTIGNTLWVCITDLMAFGKPDRSITITITAEEVKTDAAGKKTVNIDAIAKKLKDAGLIQYPEVFKFFATELTDKYLDIDAGTFTLNSKFDYNAMINNMIVKEAPREEIDIMIPEGYTCAQIFALLEEKKVCTVAELEVAAANGDLGDYWFLEGVERGSRYCLEGYLFPDTYRFYLDDDPVNVLKKFLDGFDYRFTDVMREKLETMKERTGLDIGIREVVIIASMIEKETANGAESYDISSVIFNRLNNTANYPYLNIDATIVYYLNGNIDPVTGLSKPLTKEQIYTDHPYNTYTRRGLPAGAISNPGRNSLDAALDPNQNTGYYYYVFNPQTGKHIFAKTLYEHEQNIKYVNSLK